MWVEIYPWKNSTTTVTNVILFVRMWVEIHTCTNEEKEATSSSSWGCELKYPFPGMQYPHNRSSSSWGCELKYCFYSGYTCKSRHPLREDVSWNNVYDDLKQKLMGHPLREDVSWNTASALFLLPPFVILFVRMWVEMYGYKARPSEHWSSSSWGCELKCKRYI